MGSDELIGSEEAAAILGWSKAKVNRRASAGDLPVAHKGPGRTSPYLFRREVINLIVKQTGRQVAA